MKTETEIESFAQRVKKLLESQPIISSGMEYEGKYELKKSLALIPELLCQAIFIAEEDNERMWFLVILQFGKNKRLLSIWLKT